MRKNKAMIAAAALLVASQIGGAGVASVPAADKLEMLQQYIAANDYDALREFLMANPEFLESQGPLAVSLREFTGHHKGLLVLLGFVNSTIPDAVVVAGATPGSIY